MSKLVVSVSVSRQIRIKQAAADLASLRRQTVPNKLSACVSSTFLLYLSHAEMFFSRQYETESIREEDLTCTN